MKSEKIIEKFSELPSSAQKKAKKFIDFLYKSEIAKRKRKRTKSTEYEFIGMWKNRKDMEDASNWKKMIRKIEWNIK